MSAADVIVKPAGKCVYYARRSDLTLVRKPVQKLYDQHGVVRGITDADRVHFRDGRFECPHTGKVLIDGGEVDAAELNEWLQEHRLYGDALEGFVLEHAPAPAPSQDEIRAIMAASQNREELRAILEAEQDGWQRPQIAELVEEALARLDAPQPPREAAQTAKQGEKA